MTTAIGYIRISEDPYDKRLGVERQHEDVKALAQHLDADLVKIYEDNDISAFTVRKESSGWGQALAAIRHEKPDYLLVFKQDRIGRRLADIEGLDDLCRTTGTKVIAVEGGNVFENPAWPMLAAVAKMESQNTSIRVRRAQEAKRAKGLPTNGGLRPYGYDHDRMTVIPYEAQIVRECAKRVIAGESLGSVVGWLNETGERTSTGAVWSVATLRRVLRNPRYVGDLAKGFHTPNGPEIIGKAAWQPILDRSVWEALQDALPRVGRQSRGKPSTSLLSGVLRCQRCLTRMVSNGDGAYRCNRMIGGCGRTTANIRIMDEHITKQLLDRYSDDVLKDEKKDAFEEVWGLDRKARNLAWRIDEVRTAHQEDRLDSRDFYPLYDELRRERDRTTRLMAAAQTRLELAGDSLSARKHWQEWSVQKRRSWVRQHVAAILVEQPGPGRREPKTQIEYL